MPFWGTREISDEQRSDPALFVSFAAACWFAPTAWVLLVPALLPVIGLAPWSGWITFEEWDLLVLAAASAGYARMAAQRRWPRHPAADGSSPLVWLLLALFAASQSLALMRGFDDAGGFVFGFSQGYREPMNSLRLGKGLFAALLLLPLWLAVHRTDPAKASRQLAIGLALGPKALLRILQLKKYFFCQEYYLAESNTRLHICL